MTIELATRPATGVLEFSEAQTQLIRDTFANGASEADFAVLMEVARARRLNPLMRQIYFVSRFDSQKNRKVWSTQISIDGLRAVAQRTGVYAGQDEPEYITDEKGRLLLCKVRVYRSDWGNRPSVGVAYFEEYAQKVNGTPTSFWQRMPHVMLAKCAESLAIRKAFPEDTAGLYTPEEMGAGVVVNGTFTEDSAPAPRSVARQVAQLESPSQTGALAELHTELARHAGPVPVETAHEIVRKHYPSVAAEGDGAIVAAQSAVKDRVAHGGKGKVAEAFNEQGRALAEQRRAEHEAAKAAPSPSAADERAGEVDWRTQNLADLPSDSSTTTALLASLRSARDGAEILARWREAEPSVNDLPESEATGCRDAAISRWAQLMKTTNYETAAHAFSEALKSPPDGPKPGRKVTTKPAADAQGSSAEAAPSAGPQARAPHPESAPYAQSADQWDAHLASKTSAYAVAGSWGKHSPAMRAAGAASYAKRLRAAVGRHMALSGLDESKCEAILLTAERDADDAAMVAAQAVATGKSETTVRRAMRDAEERLMKKVA